MKLFKGFERDLTCRGFQFEQGKTYVEKRAELCSVGFHACENPLDCFIYYPPGSSVYHEVELDDVSKQTGDDTKRVGKKITIGAEIGIRDIVNGAINFVFNRAEWTGENSATGEKAGTQATGDKAGAQATGDNAGAQVTGRHAGAQVTGVMACATAVGFDSTAFADGAHAIAVAAGRNTKAKGTMGTWLVIAERGAFDCDCGYYPILTVKTAKVDGEGIKPNVWYTLVDGQFVEDEN